MTTPSPAIVLTERQTHILWMLSVGRTRAEIVETTRSTKGAVDAACARIHVLLNASSAAQAVRNGLLLGFIGPYEDCGSLAAYRRHLKNEEPVCPACKRGSRARTEAEATARNRPVRLSTTQLRLLRAYQAGQTWDQVAASWGVSKRTVKYMTTALYTALGVSHLPQSVRREAALREAGRHGLLGGIQPLRPRTPARPVTLSETQVRILLELEKGATLAQTAARLDMRLGSCSTRVSEVYRRLDVAWMDKGVRREAALRKARALNLLPEPATT